MLKLSHEIPDAKSGNVLFYQVLRGAFWFHFLNPDGFGESWIIEESSTPDEFIRACYAIRAKKKITIITDDALTFSNAHEFKFEFLEEDGNVILTHSIPNSKKIDLWSMKLTYQHLIDIAMSIEQFFGLN